MTKRNTKKQPVSKLSELDLKVSQADPIIKHAFSEYPKEVSRLQKLLVKQEITHKSEIARLKESFEQNKLTVNIANQGTPPKK
jgi:hypothetical protein